MRYSKQILLLLAAFCCASCADELGQTQFNPHEPRPFRQTMSVEVIASIDNLDKPDTEALAPEDYPNMLSLWKWEQGDAAYAVYEIDGATDICETSDIAIDPSDESRATLSFKEVPVEAKILTIGIGSSGAIGSRINAGTVLDKSMCWQTGDVQSEKGEALIAGVVLKNRCAYIRLDGGKVTMNGLPFEVSRIKISGTGLFSGTDGDSIDLDMQDAQGSCLVPVCREATDVSVIATISAGDKQVASFPSLLSMPMLCRVDDSGDDTEKITLKASVTLDAASRSLVKTMAPDMLARTPGIWQWEEGDKLVADVLVGGISGTLESDAVEIDPADAGKAVFTFSKMPSTAKVTALTFGSQDAFAKTCSATEPVRRDMLFAKADVTSAIGATTISTVDMKHQCSYLDVYVTEVEIEEQKYPVSSFSISGIGIKGDSRAGSLTLTNNPEAADSVWVAVSALTTTLQVVANTEVSGAMIFNLPTLGGICNLFKVRPGSVQKVDYRTVLYSDGTLIFNEMSTNAVMNSVLHGEALVEYPALTDTEAFIYKDANSVLWASQMSKIKAVEFGSVTKPSSMSFWFSGASNLVSFNSSNLNLEACSTFQETFKSCSSLSDIDVSQWNMSAATSCYSMFEECSSLTSLNTSQWNTSSLTTIQYMFKNCSKLQTLDVSLWDVSKVLSFKFTFQACSSLAVLDVSRWVTSSVNDIQGVFRECTSLKELNVLGWDVSKVTTMFQTFYGLKITSLDISGWNLSNVGNYENFCSGSNKLVTIDMSGCDLRAATSTNNMFRNCSSLETIYANDKCDLTGLSKDKSKGMFYKCVKLRGGLGTMLSDMVVSNNESDEVSALKYARVDKEGAPGLFTEKVK